MKSYTITVNGTAYEVTVEENGNAAAPVAAAPKAAAPAAGGVTITSPMPGKILDIKVKVGDAVGYGQCVIVMEAMKMETEIVAPAAGTVASINVSTGDSVETGAVLVTLN